MLPQFLTTLDFEKEIIGKSKWRFHEKSRDNYFEVEIMP